MAVDGIRLTSGAPQFLGSGAPATAADENAMMAFVDLAVRGVVATIANLDDVTDDTPLYNGLIRKVTAAPGCAFVRAGGAWYMIGVAQFADATARNAAIPVPQTGWRSRLATDLFDREYLGAAWRPIGGVVPVKPVSVAGSGVTVDSFGVVSFSGSSTLSVNGVYTGDFRDYLIEFDVVSKSSVVDSSLRLRAAGADAAGANYNYSRGFDSGSARTVASAATATSLLCDIGGAAAVAQIIVAGPALAAATLFSIAAGSAGIGATVGGAHSLATSYDGFTIFPSSGNVSGQLRVLGIV